MVKEITPRDEIIPKLGEVFREYGYEGTSLTEITKQTGLGKSSLYYFFPKGKSEMAEAVLNEIDRWFEGHVFMPLRESDNPVTGISSMFKEVKRYFDSGNRICLVGAFALDNTRDQFSNKIKGYFKEWVDAITLAIRQRCVTQNEAKILAEDVVAGIQGALVLARSQNDSKIFTRNLKGLEKRIIDAIDD